MSEPVISPKTYLATFVALLVLLALTVGISYVDLGSFHLAAGMGISLMKTVLIAVFFMHLKTASGLIRLSAAAGAVLLLILLGLTFADYVTR